MNAITAWKHGRAMADRLLQVVHGQGDELDNPLPGFWGRAGGARVDTMKPQPCYLDFETSTELDLEVPPSDTRTFSGMTAAEKRAAREHQRERAIGAAQGLVGVVLAGAVLAFLMLVMRGGAA